MESLKGKFIVLAGATGGIGQSLARMLHTSGARLFLTGRDEAKLSTLAGQLPIDASQAKATDLSVPEQVQGLRDAVFAVFPQVDILINVSGIGIIKPIAQLDEHDFMKTLQVNLFAPFLLIRAFLPAMK
ncbi:MAG TPA: SDR family NAD(P)-dependent oxidoreductase, partial [Ferruginibacter sp.]|nr:SDR family NAD(P)-dependent oxidoreductase [Ferruginibacter sp.]